MKKAGAAIQVKTKAKYEQIAKDAREALRQDERVRVPLPEYGRLSVDRRLPFLALYRKPSATPDPGTDQFVTTEASYLFASGNASLRQEIAEVVRSVCEVAATSFGRVLLVEIWTRPDTHPPVTTGDTTVRPAFRIFCSRSAGDQGSLVDALTRALQRGKVSGASSRVETVTDPRQFPRRVRPVFSPPQAEQLFCVQLGIEVEPIFQLPDREGVYPELLRGLRTHLGRALKQTFFHFAQNYTSHSPKSYHSLGRRAVVQAVYKVDEQLDQISRGFDFLLELNPSQPTAAWTAFRRSNFEKPPALTYQPLPLDPGLAKRQLYAIPLERIEDPGIAHLFRQKQDELDRQLTMLGDRGTKNFLLGSMQVYGRPSTGLLRTAEEIFERIPPSSGGESGSRGLRAEEFKQRAEQELAHYRALSKSFEGTAHITSDIVGGLMVSRGKLLISPNSRTPPARVDALLQHEIGTHVVTYFNGKSQRLAQLCNGLAGYEELQEGLAVLAEYLVGGLTPARLRTLAGRVVGAKMLVDGATFVDTFRMLCRYGFGRRPAFNMTLRLYRGGGLTKDIIYLRGLLSTKAYLETGGELEPLYVGKIATEHLPIVLELQRRSILRPPELLPRFLEDPGSQARLERLRSGMNLVGLLEK